jgi:hypothetical protein
LHFVSRTEKIDLSMKISKVFAVSLNSGRFA